MSRDQETILTKLGNSLIYYPKLAKVAGGVTAAVCLSYLLTQKGDSNWFSLKDNLEEETGLTGIEWEKSCKKLRDRGLLRERLHPTTPPALEYYLDLLLLQEKLSEFDNLLSQVPKTENPPPKSESDPFYLTRRLTPTTPIRPDYKFTGPWPSQAQFEAFQKALLEYFKQKGYSNPAAGVFQEIDKISKGIISPLWTEFTEGKPLGSSQQIQRDWEIAPGIPYPAFEEERIQYYLHKGETIEQATMKARSDLRNPVLGKDLWDGFLRKCDRIADQALQVQKLGVKNPYLPPSFTDKPAIDKESVMAKLARVASPKTLSSETPPAIPLEPNVKIPNLEDLQKAYNTALGKTLIARQIDEHPEWGYQIIDGKIVDVSPF